MQPVMKLTSNEEASCEQQRGIMSFDITTSKIFMDDMYAYWSIKYKHLKCEIRPGCLERVEQVVGALVVGDPHVESLLPAEIALVVEDVHVDPGEGSLPSSLLVEDREAETSHSWNFAHLTG